MSDQTSNGDWGGPTRPSPVEDIRRIMAEMEQKYGQPIVLGPVWNCPLCRCGSTPISITTQFYLYKCHCGFTWATVAMQTRGVEEPVIPREVLSRLATDAELRMRTNDAEYGDTWQNRDANTEANLARDQWRDIWGTMKALPRCAESEKKIIARDIARQAADLTAYLAFLIHHVHEEAGLKWTAPWEEPEQPTASEETIVPDEDHGYFMPESTPKSEVSPGVNLRGTIRELTERQNETDRRIRVAGVTTKTLLDNFEVLRTRINGHVAELRRKMEAIETAESEIRIKVKEDGRILVYREVRTAPDTPPALEYLTWSANGATGKAYYAFRRDVDAATFFDSDEDVRAGITLWHMFGRKAFV